MRRLLLNGALIVLGTLTGLLVCEAGLQVAAFVTWRHALQRSAATPAMRRASRERVVLCIGDSFTYGIGASSAETAYPAQLEHALNAASTEVTWRVLNHGWPGRNSAEVLQQLPASLSARPDYVIILVGTNNQWSHAAMNLPAPALQRPTVEPGSITPWQWRLRTWRFFELALAPQASRAPAPTGHSTEGVPRRRAQAPRAATDNSVLINELFNLQSLLATRDGANRAAVSGKLNALRPAVRAADDRRVVRLYFQILTRVAGFEDIIEEGQQALDKYGHLPEICAPMVEPLARLGRFDEALAFADEAVDSHQGGSVSGWYYKHRAYVHMKMGHGAEALIDEIRSFAVLRDGERLRTDLRQVRSRVPQAFHNNPEILATLELSAEVRGEVQRAIDEVLGEGDDSRRVAATETLEQKLRQDLDDIIRLARASGAQPVLLTNAKRDNLFAIASVQRQVASQRSVPLVDMDAAFAELLAHGRIQDYFIHDGHCNDSGYRVMAEQVARTIRVLDR